MKSKFIANYNQTIEPIRIHKILVSFDKNLRNELEERLNITELMPPMFSSKGTSSEIFQTLESRMITFGTATDGDLYSLYNNFNYWIRNKLTEFKIENNSGVYIYTDYIKRDTEDDNLSALRKREIQLEMRYEGDNPNGNVLEVSKKINDAIVAAVAKTAKEANVTNRLKKITYVDFEESELNPSIEGEEISTLAEKYGIVGITKNNSEKRRNIQFPDNHTLFETVAWSRVLNKHQTLVKAGVRTPLSELNERVREGVVDPKDETIFAIKQLNKKTVDSTYYKIYTLNILKQLLDLEHVGELLPDTQSTELEDIKANFGIKHI